MSRSLQDKTQRILMKNAVKKTILKDVNRACQKKIKRNRTVKKKS